MVADPAPTCGDRRPPGTVRGVSRRGSIVTLAVAAQMSISLIQFGLPALTFALKDDLGIGAAAVAVAGRTAILAQFPPERRGRLLGVRQMAVPAGGFVAAGLLPALHDLGGLRLAFAVPAGLVLVCGLGFAVVVGSPAD